MNLCVEKEILTFINRLNGDLAVVPSMFPGCCGFFSAVSDLPSLLCGSLNLLTKSNKIERFCEQAQRPTQQAGQV